MLSIWQILLVLLSAIFVGIADALIKKISATHSFLLALKDPWMLVICLLYLIQVAMIVYIFAHKGDLVIYGNMFIICYSVITVIFGLLIFKEQVSLAQILGIVLALTGAFLINR